MTPLAAPGRNPGPPLSHQSAEAFEASEVAGPHSGDYAGAPGLQADVLKGFLGGDVPSSDAQCESSVMGLIFKRKQTIKSTERPVAVPQ